jgi:tripartite ATP-independent transporter DctP family solute receptor
MATEREKAMKGTGLTASRRAIIGAALAMPFVRVGKARAAEFEYRLATGQSLAQPINARLEQACGRIREATGGRLDIHFFPASQLGSDTDLIAQVRSGGVDFLNIAGSVLSTFVPAAGITNVGFAFSSYQQVWSAVDGKLGASVRTQIEKAGIVVMSKAADNGFRQITSSERQIRKPEDLAGVRIRVPVSPIFTALFKALGAGPTSINFNELYTALQTHIVDGQENSLTTIDAGKLYEVQKYVSESNHIWDPFWLIGNRRAVAALPEDVRAIAQREFDRAADEQRADSMRLNDTLKADLMKKGLTFLTIDQAAFRATLASSGFYKEWRDKFGQAAWASLEAVVGPMA